MWCTSRRFLWVAFGRIQRLLCSSLRSPSPSLEMLLWSILQAYRVASLCHPRLHFFWQLCLPERVQTARDDRLSWHARLSEYWCISDSTLCQVFQARLFWCARGRGNVPSYRNGRKGIFPDLTSSASLSSLSVFIPSILILRPSRSGAVMCTPQEHWKVAKPWRWQILPLWLQFGQGHRGECLIREDLKPLLLTFRLKDKLYPSIFPYSKCNAGVLVDFPRGLAFEALDAL